MSPLRIQVITFYNFFFALICLAFATEPLGLPYGRQISFFIICINPFLVGYLYIVKKNKLVIPLLPTLTFLVFLLFIIFSEFFTGDLVNTFSGIFFYSGLYSTFILGINGKQEITNKVLKLLLIMTFLLPIYGIISRNWIYPIWPMLIPESGYQLVFAKFGLHNHLGDFIAIMMSVLTYFYLKSRKKRYLIVQLLLFPYLIYSYSRTAYLTFIVLNLVVFFLKRKMISKLVYIISALTIIFVILFSFLTINEDQTFFSSKATEPIRNSLFINQKPLWSMRIEFLTEAVRSIKEKPVFGLGFNNFYKASKKYSSIPHFSTESSHNIFFDVLSEHGIPAGIAFLIMIVTLIKKSAKNMLIIIILGLLLLFQTDYVHRIYAMIFLFFLLNGLNYQKNDLRGI